MIEEKKNYKLFEKCIDMLNLKNEKRNTTDSKSYGPETIFTEIWRMSAIEKRTSEHRILP